MRFRARIAALLATLMLVAGGAVVSAPAASAHIILERCRGSHFQPPYQNDIVRRTIQSGVGTYGPWVETDWKSTNRITKSVHYHHTELRCFRLY